MVWLQREGWVWVTAGERVWRLYVTVRYQPGEPTHAAASSAQRSGTSRWDTSGHAVAKQALQFALVQQQAAEATLRMGRAVDVRA